ncbi:CPBP family intramembrane glutamic endopeptidase [Raoultibacter massiliensis]|uniref:CPBP family intramembrane glutamic endopeptidase n=1 Tax=Raoultibacter massiliensis TaxID=1852371 RepID=A0ABV1J954_9ACTN|nr:CPBP family intramembrane glutamic endopeptidase [Raoultibacter massiliensis]
MKRIIIYLAVTFAITYALEIFIVVPLATGTAMGGALAAPPVAVQLIIGSMMFVPAIGVLITRLVTKEGFKNAMIKPVDFRHTFKYYLIAWFGPAALTIAGAAVYFLIFPSDFDPTMSAAMALLQSSTASQGGAELPADVMQIILWVQIGVGIVLSPVLNCLTCFGEEWGWRGYLVPKVNERLSFVPTVLVTGVIWGLWHAPLTVIGHNYGVGYPGWPFLGIFAMCIFCIVIGTLFSYLSLKAKSCLPAVIGHGAVNGFVGAAALFSLSGGNPFIGPMPIGILGGIGFIVAAIVCCALMRREEKRASSPVAE